jgi:membrane-associated phospholipid phosphatase
VTAAHIAVRALSRGRAGLLLLALWAALLAGGLLAGLAVEGNGLDGRIVRGVAADRTPALTSAARLITELGSGWLLPVAALLGAVLFLAGRPRHGLVLLVAVAGATLVTDTIKLILERPRPPGGGLVATASSSWPSGHAATTAACFGALAAMAGRWARAGAVVVVGAVGATRVYLGVHYPSDVIAGWALGGLWLCAVVVLLGGRDPTTAVSRRR